MPYKNGNNPPNKIAWTQDMIIFLTDNYEKMTNQELADHLGFRLTSTRTKLIELGFKRMEMQYWTEEQILFLNENYKTIGDTELAAIFTEMYYKAKGWTKKHIEKKRRYLNLKRTEDEKVKIKERNRVNGMWASSHWKRWFERIAPEGQIRIWKSKQTGQPFKVIKVTEGFVHYPRWLFESIWGPVPEGMIVRLLDDDPMNVVPENLTLITRSEHAVINGATSSRGLSNNYVAGILSHNQNELRIELLKHPELLQLKKQQLIINRKIKQHEQTKN